MKITTVNNYLIFLPLLLVNLVNCNTTILNEERVLELNKEYLKQEWMAKDDLYQPLTDKKEQAVYKKGTKLFIYLVTNDSWIKIKAFDSSERREQARGKTIIFLLMDDLMPGLEKISEKQGEEGSRLALESYINKEITRLLQPLKSGK